ncbi:MAG: hypothetical protein AAGJ82_01145, partial [Bacteroidota bacterium]
LGLNVHRGFTTALSDNWHLDFSYGLGVRYNVRNYSDIPNDAGFRTNGEVLLWKYSRERGNFVSLNAPIVIALAYRWK